MKILHIDSATTGAASVSREVSAAATAHFKELYPDAEVVYRDLGVEPLAHLTPTTTGAIRLPADAQDDNMKAAFPTERAVLDEFLSSDIVVIGAPMYNFTIPSQLKSWLDRLGVPGVTFSYSEAGPQGLAGGRKVVIVSSQGGEYEQGGVMEHQEQYLKDFFGFIGIDDPIFVRANKTGFGPDIRAASIAAAKEQIAAL
ncbi:FMN-dependent NADH-azoreductase [Altericroceibacterium spongiae]|uniref:FMN dependent NADH:quinone oxidoreductase n=1 Tax=Altericroceibacterium spongiae TaxID=2320269 RepID=A0A420EF45_9SPHN|nr:NAD(P)H-dependent oxidoreductase [Altericroceibacterium spongiae]RKF19321.1 FMN-dependent NADH-azoreductase [Altericroceibacterium spongiae]